METAERIREIQGLIGGRAPVPISDARYDFLENPDHFLGLRSENPARSSRNVEVSGSTSIKRTLIRSEGGGTSGEASSSFRRIGSSSGGGGFESLDSPTIMRRHTTKTRGRPISINFGPSSSFDYDYEGPSTPSAPLTRNLGASAVDNYNRRFGKDTDLPPSNYYNMDSVEGRRSKINRYSKFLHYYIPKHYGGTPMGGGYLMSTAGTNLTWKY